MLVRTNFVKYVEKICLITKVIFLLITFSVYFVVVHWKTFKSLQVNKSIGTILKRVGFKKQFLVVTVTGSSLIKIIEKDTYK